MADFYGVENGLAAGYTPEQGGFEQELADSATLGLAQAEQQRLDRAQTSSKIAEKQRRLLQTKERKQRELIGGDPVDYGTDSFAVRKMKELANIALPHDYQIPVERGGKQYTTQNKNFNSENLANVWNDTKDDPNGDSVLYYMRKEDGYNDDGTVKWLYKPGIAKFGSENRYKDQLNQEGWQLLGEKRTNNATQIEAMIHGNETFLKERTHDYGQASLVPGEDQYKNTFGAGKSELYDTDILGLGDQTTEQVEANRILGMDNEAAYRKKIADDQDGRFGNLVDALQSRSVSTVAGMADAVYDTFSDNEHNALNDWKDTTKTDKLFGYNSNTSASGLDQAAMDFKTGNYLSMLGNAFAVAPELIAESIPEMATMMRTVGLGAITAMRSNDIMDDILENNEGQITSGQRMQAITAGTLMTALDKFGLDEMVSKNAIGKKLMKKVFDNSSEQASKGVARKLVEKTAQLTLAGEAEAGTEMLQEIVEAYGGKFGTAAEKDLWNEEMIDSIIKAGLGGFAAGSTMRGGADLVQATLDKAAVEPGSVEPVYSQVNNVILKTAQDMEDGIITELSQEDKDVIVSNIEEAKASIDDTQSQEERVTAAEAILRSIDNVAAANSYPTTEAHQVEIEAAKAVLAQEEAKLLASTTEEVAPVEPIVQQEPEIQAQQAELDALLEEEDVLPTVKEVADKIIAGKELTAEDLQVQQNEGEAIEAELAKVKPIEDVVPETKYSKKGTLDGAKIDPRTADATMKNILDNVGEKEANEYMEAYKAKQEERLQAHIDKKKAAEAEAKPKAKPKRFKKTEPKKDDGDIPGPLKAFINTSKILLESIKFEPKVTKFKKVFKNVAGKGILREQSQRKREKRVAPQVTNDAQIVEVFKSGAYDAKTIANPKLLKKQTRIQTTQSIEEKSKVIARVQKVLKSGKIGSNEAINTKFNEMFEGANEGGALRLALIALHTITENIKSNVDVANNNDFEIETLYSSRQDVAKEISRKFIATYGQQMIPTKDGSTDAINLEHINIGNVAIEMLKEMGYIQTYEGTEGIADVGSSTIVWENNENIDRDTVKVGRSRVPEITGANIIQFVGGIIDTKGTKENLRSNKVVSVFSEMLSPIMQAMDPANERNPDHYPDFSDVEGKDHEMSNASNDIILSVGAKPMYIKPDTLDLLKEIAKLTKNETLADVMNKNPWIKVMFGISPDDTIVETEALSASGKNISRMHNAEAVVNAIKEYIAREADGEAMNMAELYFTYFSAVNMRIHADEIAFNFQSDNFFARHILSPVEDTYTTENETDVETLVLAVADELGLEPAEIMFYQDPSDTAQETVLDGLNAMLQGEEILDTKDYYDPIFQTDPRTRELFQSGKSVNSVIKAIQAVHAIRQGVSESGGDWKKAKISSNYAIEHDGNTSGLVNKLLNMLGGANNSKVYEFIKRLTVKEPGKNLDDGYLILAEEVRRLIKDKIAAAAKRSANPRANKDIKGLIAIEKFLNEIDKTMRETSKSPMMNNLYGQMNEALSRNLGFILSGKAVTLSKEGSENIADAKALIGELSGIEINPESFTFQQKKDLANKIGTILGSIFGDALINVNHNLSEDSQAMYDAYDSMYKAAHIINEDLVMRNPYDIVHSALYGAEQGAHGNDFGFSIEKKKIVAMGQAVMDAGSVLPTEEQFMANPNSQKVMPLHAIDSAILLIAYKKTIEKLGLDYDGSMSVHDAVYSTPKFMALYREMYNESAFDVAQHYDLINETLFEIDYLIEKMTAEKGSPAVIADLKKHKAILEQGNQERLELKQGQLLELQEAGASVFGTYNIEMPESGVRPEPTPDKPIKKETKQEPIKAEPVQKKDEVQAIAEKAPVHLNKLMKIFAQGTVMSERLSIQLLKNIKVGLGSKSGAHIDTIINFIEGSGLVKKGKDFEYIPESDTVVVPDGTYDSIQSTQDVLKYIAHEIEHKATAKWLFEQSKLKNPSKEYKIVKKFLDKLKSADITDIEYEDKNSFDMNTYDRIKYIMDPSKSEYEQMAEFIAIYRTNSNFRHVVKNKLSSSDGAIKVILRSIKALVNAGMNALTKVDARSMTIDTLNDVMNNIIILGEQSRIGSPKVEAPKLGAGVIVSEIDSALNFKPYKGSTPLYFMPFESKIVSFNHWAKEGISKGIKVAAGTLIDNEWVQKMHKNQMKIEDGFYNKTAQLIQERFEPGAFMTRLITYMQLNQQFDYKNIRQWHTAINKAKQARNQVDTDMLIKAKRTFDATAKNYSPAEIKAIEKIFNSSLIHELKNENDGTAIIDQILESNDPIATIDTFIQELESQLTSGDLRINDQTIRSYGIGSLAEDIASYYRTGRLGKLARNEVSDHHVMRRLAGQKLKAFNTLIALKQLKLGGKTEIAILNKFKKDSVKSKTGNSYNEFMIVSSANHNISYKVDQDIDGNNQGKFDNVTGSHILFEENYEFLAVDEGDYKRLEDREGSPWIILTKPDDNGGKIGVVARIRDDFGMQSGIVSSTNLNSDGVQVTRKQAEGLNPEASNIIRTGSAGDYQYKIILTNDMASKLSVQENPASNMYRSYGHNTEIFEGKSVLSHLLATESKHIATKEDADALESQLKKGGKIDTIFINFDHNSPEIDIRDYPEIRKQYVEAKGLTNVLGFNRRVNMVHRNMKDTMVGYTRDALVSPTNPKLRKAEAILRNFVTMFAGHVVMGNPGKIAMDALSNLSILMANNVPFLSMAKYGREAMKWGVEITNLRNDYIFEQMALFSMKPGSDEYNAQQTKVDKMFKDINDHPFAVALNNGMIQSLSTSMMMKDKESMSDLQKRANAVFNKIGDIPGAKKAIFAFAKFGVGTEDILEFARKATKEGSTIDKELAYMADKLRRIKEEEDLAAYLSEIIATPGQSEILRIGGVATLGVDLTSKWILYKHTMDTLVEDSNIRVKRMTSAQKQEAAIELSVNSFINYMDNLPHEIDMAKELGVWMFPHFMIRVQKVIWGLFYNRLFGSSLATSTALIAGDFGPSIYGSAFPSKMPAHFEPNMSAVFPTEIMNIPFV